MKSKDAEANTTNIGMLWIVTNAISWCIGITIGFILELKIAIFVQDLNNNLWGISDTFSNLISAIVLGLIVGFGQTLVLRRLNQSIKWHWTLSTLLGIVIATFLINASGSHTLYSMDCFFCFGGINLPSRILNIWPWNSVGGQRFTFGDPITSSLIGLAVGASQYYFYTKQEFITAWWILWSTIGFILALIGAYIMSLFIDDILIVGITQGVLYGLVTVRPLTRQLKKHNQSMQETQVEAA